MRDPQVHVRFPVKVKEWIIKTARRNERSINAQIVFIAKNAMEKEKAEEGTVESASSASQQSVRKTNHAD